MRRFSYFGVCADVRKELHVGISNLRIYARGGRLEFLLIGADFLFMEFLQTYAKKPRFSIMNLRVYANGVRLDMEDRPRKTFRKTLVSAYMRRCSCFGVSADVRKKAPRL